MGVAIGCPVVPPMLGGIRVRRVLVLERIVDTGLFPHPRGSVRRRVTGHTVHRHDVSALQ